MIDLCNARVNASATVHSWGRRTRLPLRLARRLPERRSSHRPAHYLGTIW